MAMANDNNKPRQKKCYNTFSCIASVLIIIFITGAILLDLIVTKPLIYNSIEDVRTEVKIINKKIDDYYSQPIDSTHALIDSLEYQINHSVSDSIK